MRSFAKNRVNPKFYVRLLFGLLAFSTIRASLIAHAIRCHLVTRFTSLVAVEEVVANVGGEWRTVPVPTELPAGMQMDKVFGAPATGTADARFSSCWA